MWLLSDSVLQAFNRVDAGSFNPTHAQLENFAAASTESASRQEGKTAVIEVKGVLTPEPDLFAFLFGGGNTTYSEIQQALVEANKDPAVSQIELHINSPGGNVAGLFETADAIAASDKPVTAFASQAASAAYALAAQADRIVATGRGADFGSLGVKTQRRVDGELVTITSSNAPNKAPDASTEEGVAAIQAELDEIEKLFIGDIAAGRGTTSDKVIANFGKGRVFLAEEALKRGMIDDIAAQSNTAQRGNKEAKSMDLQTLRAEHPAVFAEAVAEGVAEERDRVAAFAIGGRESGEIEAALQHIENGDKMTSALQMKFAMSAAKRSHMTAHQEDSDLVSAATENAIAPQMSQEDKDNADSAALTDAFLASRGVAGEV